MKKFITSLAIFGAILVFAQTATNMDDFKENIKSNREEAKKAIKPYLYDGYKTTYFNFKTFAQSKEVEIYLFNNTDYKLSFNGKSSPKDITVKIYDEAKSNPKRVLLKEFNGISGNNIVVNTTELEEVLKKTNKNAARLKRVFVNYEIPATPTANNKTPDISDRGAIVLVMGYKN